MDRVPLVVGGGGRHVVLPPDAMGYLTEDNVRILGWNYETGSFFLADNTTKTHGEISLCSHLLPPQSEVPMPPLGTYAHCPLLGDCRIEMVGSRAVRVRSATATAAMLPSTLLPLGAQDVAAVGRITVLIPGDRGFIFHNVTSSGGAMGLVSKLCDYLRSEFGLQVDGEISVYERRHDHVMPLAGVRSHRSMLLEFRGTMSFTKNAPATHEVALAHHDAMEYVDAYPWALPCTLATVLTRLDLSPQLAAPHLVGGPYKLKAGLLKLVAAPPKCVHSPLSVPDDVLVQGVRSGNVMAFADGVYAMAYSDGGFGSVVSPSDLAATLDELESTRDLYKVVGEYNLRDRLPFCPVAWLMERFGSTYNVSTGVFTSA